MSYKIKFTDGQIFEESAINDAVAIEWVRSVLAARGYNAAGIIRGDWESGGNTCDPMLFWLDDISGENDCGANAICELCVVR